VPRGRFSPEDAEFAPKLKPLPETAAQIAQPLPRPVELLLVHYKLGVSPVSVRTHANR
jgi:hypothetical protein